MISCCKKHTLQKIYNESKNTYCVIHNGIKHGHNNGLLSLCISYIDLLIGFDNIFLSINYNRLQVNIIRGVVGVYDIFMPHHLRI